MSRGRGDPKRGTPGSCPPSAPLPPGCGSSARGSRRRRCPGRRPRGRPGFYRCGRSGVGREGERGRHRPRVPPPSVSLPGLSRAASSGGGEGHGRRHSRSRCPRSCPRIWSRCRWRTWAGRSTAGRAPGSWSPRDTHPSTLSPATRLERDRAPPCPYRVLCRAAAARRHHGVAPWGKRGRGETGTRLAPQCRAAPSPCLTRDGVGVVVPGLLRDVEDSGGHRPGPARQLAVLGEGGRIQPRSTALPCRAQLPDPITSPGTSPLPQNPSTTPEPPITPRPSPSPQDQVPIAVLSPHRHPWPRSPGRIRPRSPRRLPPSQRRCFLINFQAL